MAQVFNLCECEVRRRLAANFANNANRIRKYGMRWRGGRCLPPCPQPVAWPSGGSSRPTDWRVLQCLRACTANPVWHLPMKLIHPLPAEAVAATYAAAKTENYGKVRKMAKNPGRNSRRNRNDSEQNGTDSLQVTGYWLRAPGYRLPATGFFSSLVKKPPRARQDPGTPNGCYPYI